MSYPQNVCIYCGKPGRTKEHYWGKWLAKLMTDAPLNTQHTLVHPDPETGEISYKKGSLTRQGSVYSQQIKGPCVTCNNGWMKKTNEKAKDVIVSLIKNGPFAMSDDERLAFARWAVMHSMTFEFADLLTLTSTEDDRRDLMVRSVPPLMWGVYIARFIGDKWQGVHNHRRLRMFDGITGNERERPGQTNVFVFGNTVVNTTSRMFNGAVQAMRYAEDRGLYTVWPLVENVTEAGMSGLNDDEISEIAFPS